MITKSSKPAPKSQSPYDVICEKAVWARDSIGSRRFRILCETHSVSYNKADKSTKTRIVNSIIESVKSAGGRFIRLDVLKGQWEDLEPGKIRDKVGHCLRDTLKSANKQGKPRRITQVIEGNFQPESIENSNVKLFQLRPDKQTSSAVLQQVPLTSLDRSQSAPISGIAAPPLERSSTSPGEDAGFATLPNAPKATNEPPSADNSKKLGPKTSLLDESESDLEDLLNSQSTLNSIEGLPALRRMTDAGDEHILEDDFDPFI